MKKEKHSVINDSTSFSFDENNVDYDKVFEGYPPFEPPYDEVDRSFETNMRIALEHVFTILKYSDEHPPYVPSEACGRSIFLYIIFESSDQIIDFKKQIKKAKVDGIDFKAEEFAEAVGIDLTTGKLQRKSSSQSASNGLNFTQNNSLNFGTSSFDFNSSKKKPEISDQLKAIREDEKNLAKYMKWTAENNYFLSLCFLSENEKENMLKALNLQPECNGRFLWCHDVARVLGIELLPCHFKNKQAYVSGRDKKLENLVDSNL